MAALRPTRPPRRSVWAKLQEAERQAAAWKEMAELNARMADEAGRERDN